MARLIFQIAMVGLLAVFLLRAGWDIRKNLAQNNPLDATVHADSSMLAPLEQRFELFKAVLSEDAIVGYVTQPEMEATVFAEGEHAWAQSCLSPRIVRRSTDEKIIITNFYDDASLDRYCRSHPVQISAHVGPGLAVLKNLDASKTSQSVGKP